MYFLYMYVLRFHDLSIIYKKVYQSFLKARCTSVEIFKTQTRNGCYDRDETTKSNEKHFETQSAENSRWKEEEKRTTIIGRKTRLEGDEIGQALVRGDSCYYCGELSHVRKRNTKKTKREKDGFLEIQTKRENRRKSRGWMKTKARDGKDSIG